MSLIRPEITATLTRWREVLVGAAVAVLGLWGFTFGGLFFQGLGLLIAALGGAMGFVAFRRMQFHRDGDAPGVVEVTEGQITYLAAQSGGFAARSEITQIDLSFSPAGQAQWRIRQMGAQPLTIPVSASGADALFDAFVALPGVEPSRLLAALNRNPAQGTTTVWRRTALTALT